jgi:hypothetical protein
MFDYYPSGTSQTPTELNDIITMSQGERGILEFKYKYPGNYMFHAHKTEFAEKGWMGMFKVVDNSQEDKNESDPTSNSTEILNNASIIKNQSYFIPDSIHDQGKNNDLENNNIAYNYSSYEVSNTLHNPSQNHTNHPNDQISPYKYNAISSQGAAR